MMQEGEAKNRVYYLDVSCGGPGTHRLLGSGSGRPSAVHNDPATLVAGDPLEQIVVVVVADR